MSSNLIVRGIERLGGKVAKVITQSQRQRLRRVVALSEPSPKPCEEFSFSPHCLTCHEHLLMSVCSAKSLNLVIGTPLPWVFHDDGSLEPADKQLLLSHFPGCRLVERSQADEFFLAASNRDLHSLLRGRTAFTLLLKLADVHAFASRERILYVDSDILFFERPDALLDALESGHGNFVTKDIDTAYIASIDVLEEITGVRPEERVNSGILVLNRDDISLGRINEALQKLEAADVLRNADPVLYTHLIEQTIVAILTTASEEGVSHLPEEYDLYLEPGLRGAVCRHYVGVIRKLFELEGLRTLTGEKEFSRRWRRFARGSGNGPTRLT